MHISEIRVRKVFVFIPRFYLLNSEFPFTPPMDRFLTVNIVAPWRRIFGGRRSTLRIPILMYHSITDDPEPGVKGYYRLNTPPALFREHLEILKDEGYTVVDLQTTTKLLVENRETEHELPRAPLIYESKSPDHDPKYAVITFDDGFRDFHSHAAPALVDYGFTATNFVVTGSVGGEFKDRTCMSWPELRELSGEGFVFGSHTVNHPKLWELNTVELQSELSDSRKKLEDELGGSVETFAHPYAFPCTDSGYGSRFTSAMMEASYKAGVTTSLGRVAPGDNPLTLKRLPANGADDGSLFRTKLSGGYDWLAAPQAIFKRLKRARGSAHHTAPLGAC